MNKEKLLNMVNICDIAMKNIKMDVERNVDEKPVDGKIPHYMALEAEVGVLRSYLGCLYEELENDD